MSNRRGVPKTLSVLFRISALGYSAAAFSCLSRLLVTMAARANPGVASIRGAWKTEPASPYPISATLRFPSFPIYFPIPCAAARVLARRVFRQQISYALDQPSVPLDLIVLYSTNAMIKYTKPMHASAGAVICVPSYEPKLKTAPMATAMIPKNVK